MSFWTMRTLNQVVTDHGEIGRTKLGEIRRTEKNVGKSMVLAIRSSPKISRYFPKNVVFLPKTIFGKKLGKIGEKQRKDVRYEKSEL